MRKDEKASISAIKLICITLAIVLILGVGGANAASNITAANIQIIFPNDYELNILTTKTKISEILEDNHIVLQDNEIVTPSLNEEIGDNKVIRITKLEKTTKTEELEDIKSLEIDEIKDLYVTVVEKIETLEIEIPYETITKDISESDMEDTTTKIIQEGENGLKIVTYKITYMNEIEVDRLELDSRIIKEPINKIVQVTKMTVSRSGTDRTVSANPTSTSTTSLAKKVSGIEPKVVTLNASAYTASTCGKTATDGGYGYTASGAKAQPWYTIAAGKGYPIGTIMYIPYFEDKPNGGWFIVEDRGGAITNSKVDIYMETYSECKQFGRKNLECYIYEF